MSDPVAHTGTIKCGKFNPDDRAAFVKEFLRKDGTRMVVTVKRLVKGRSTAQNKYYHGVVVPMIGDAIGESDNKTVHEILKAKFNYEIIIIGAEEILKPLSTAKLDAKVFGEYIEKIRTWAGSFLGLYIPDPSETI